MEEINNDVVLRCLLSNCKEHSKKEEKIFSVLSEKVSYGNHIGYEAERYCVSQGWLEDKMYGIPNFRGGNDYKRGVEITELGKKQIPILWKKSEVRPWNIWKPWIDKGVTWLLALLAVVNISKIGQVIIDILKAIFGCIMDCIDYFYR
mgnify:FL=1